MQQEKTIRGAHKEKEMGFWKLLKLSPMFMTGKQRVRVIIFILALSVLGWIIPTKFTVSLTPSLRYHVFYLYRNPQMTDLHKGDYVLFEKSSKYLKNGEPLKLIKQIGCDAGDYLIEVNRDYYCLSTLKGHSIEEIKQSLLRKTPLNGLEPEYLGRAKIKSLKGEPLDNFKFSGQVPGGKCYVAGSHPDSFDSRYFGFIDKQTVIAKAYPVF